MSSNAPDTRTRILEATWKLMEERRGIGVRMGDIAMRAGVSRQALYLHFTTRTDLMNATTKYVDEIMGLEQRLKRVEAAENALAALEAYVDVWGNHLPQIYGMAKALLVTRDSDEASAAAWEDCMSSHRQACNDIIEGLHKEGILAPDWPRKEAAAMLWTILSFQTWEQLTIECGWSIEQYTRGIKSLLRQTFVKSGS